MHTAGCWWTIFRSIRIERWVSEYCLQKKPFNRTCLHSSQRARIDGFRWGCFHGIQKRSFDGTCELSDFQVRLCHKFWWHKLRWTEPNSYLACKWWRRFFCSVWIRGKKTIRSKHLQYLNFWGGTSSKVPKQNSYVILHRQIPRSPRKEAWELLVSVLIYSFSCLNLLVKDLPEENVQGFFSCSEFMGLWEENN